MLEEAQKNLKARKLTNVELLQSADIANLKFSNCFDFVHTFIVLQHIPANQGYKIIDKLLSLTCNGGYGMLHFTFSNKRSALMNSFASFKNNYYLTRGLWNLLRGKAFGTPFMQMNNYDLEKVFKKLMSHNLKQVLLEFTDHSGHLGVCVYFQK